jgi:threonine/homoserine/homoserine lactone efflux protein
MTEFIPLALVAFVCGITPGPSTVLAAGIGAGHGFVRTIPHIAGTALGYASLALVAVGAMTALSALHPLSESVLHALGAVFLLWLAWRIARSSVGPMAKFPPLCVWSSIALQWVNPKAWATVSAAAALAPEMNARLEPLAVAAAFLVLLPPGVACWASGGCTMGRLLTSARRRRLFNGAMSGALVALVGASLASA